MSGNGITVEGLATLRESWDFEAKLAAGRDGRGTVPGSFWESYSAMANSDGGLIVLGVRELADHSFEVGGLVDPERVQTELWNELQNRQKVSANLLRKEDVRVEVVDGHHILVIEVPRAGRAVRPVYINGDLLGGTYIRVHEGDRKADAERVRRMVADAEFDSRDDRLVEGYDVADLVPDTVRRFRVRHRSRSPDHPWNALDDEAYLTRIGARRETRGREPAGLTVAGLLMFGPAELIRRRFPHYFVDYQERRAVDDREWIDRVWPDGTWSGNLFDFYERVLPKLLANLKVPFHLGPDLFRREETHAHEAVREAVVNTLIHADYDGHASIELVRTPGGFRFRNPGTLRVPVDLIRKGGTSDCRNRSLQTMFLHAGLGERAGSGFDRILRAWSEQHWAAPSLMEDTERDAVTLVLTTAGLVPAEKVEALERRFLGRLAQLEPDGRVAVLAAAGEGRVTNARLHELTGTHRRDLTLLLGRLVRDGFLVSHGEGTGKWYTLPEAGPPELEGPRSAHGGWLTREEVERRIVEFCRGEFRSAKEIAAAIGRTDRTVRETYLKGMVARNLLELRVPESKRSRAQAYRAVEST